MAEASRFTVAIEVDHTTEGWVVHATLNTFTDGRWTSRPLDYPSPTENFSLHDFDQWAQKALVFTEAKVDAFTGTWMCEGDVKPCGAAVEAGGVRQDGFARPCDD